MNTDSQMGTNKIRKIYKSHQLLFWYEQVTEDRKRWMTKEEARRTDDKRMRNDGERRMENN